MKIKHIVQILHRLYTIIKILYKSKLLQQYIISTQTKKKYHKKTNTYKNIYVIINRLGPLSIKLGQLMCTRPGFIPKKMHKIFEKLYDSVTPYKSSFIRKTLKTTYKKKIHKQFKKFSNTPIAAASISQVYICTTNKDKKKIIALKVLCKHTSNIIFTDLRLLKLILKIIGMFTTLQTEKKIKSLFYELSTTLKKEQDLRIEAVNTHKAYKNIKNKYLIVPQVIWKYIKKNVLVTTFVKGLPLHNIKKIKKYNLNIKEIAKKYVELFFTQVFKYNDFQADMHPGNVLIVHKKNNTQKTPCYIVLLDFGITGTLTTKNKIYMLKNILAFIDGDYKKIVQLHTKNMNNTSTKKTSHKDIETALYYTWEPILNKKSKDIPFTELAKKLLKIAKKFKLRLKQQLLLFQKTLITVEGISRTLHPDIHLWDIVKPLLSVELAKQFLTPQKLLQKFFTKKHKKIKKKHSNFIKIPLILCMIIIVGALLLK